MTTIIHHSNNEKFFLKKVYFEVQYGSANFQIQESSAPIGHKTPLLGKNCVIFRSHNFQLKSTTLVSM